jgi:alkylated DNA nucleotide flippase Atl1
MEEQLRDYIAHVGSSEGPPDAARSIEDGSVDAIPPTNDDYRRAIKSIPSGKVAPYSAVSEVVRGDTNGSQKVAGLAANDGTLETAYRVVKKDGSIAAGFRWTDGSMGGADEGRQKLEGEGVRFDMHGRALPEFVLSAEELRPFYEATSST